MIYKWSLQETSTVRRILVLAIILIAFAVRMWGIASALPYIFHPDEPHYIRLVQHIFKQGDLNPHFFNYPSMFLYVNALAYVPYYWLGYLTGSFTSPEDVLAPLSITMGSSFAPMPGLVFLGRMLTVFWGTATVVLVFLTGFKITRCFWIGLLGATITALSPTNVHNSRFISPDPYVVFWSVATLFASTWLLNSLRVRHYLLAGLAAGFAASSKYNGGLIILAPIVIHLLRHGMAGIWDRKLYTMLIASAAAFFFITPYAILDYQKFIEDLLFEARHYATGHAGMEGNTLAWYLSYLWRIEGLIVVFALLQVIRGVFNGSRETILLATFPIVYFIFISLYVVRNDRTLVPMLAPLFLLGSILLIDFYKYARERITSTYKGMMPLLAILLIIVTVAVPARNSIQGSMRRTAVDSRTTARIWTDTNLSEGAKIVVESYAPFMNPNRFAVTGVGRAIDREAEWYLENGFDYLIFSQGMYGRFYAAPERYAHEMALYDSLFARFPLIQIFNDGGYEVRIYAVREDP
jgi:4-amino-4-deoxy-L-arabinose transferase-like glycosyltransferase